MTTESKPCPDCGTEPGEAHFLECSRPEPAAPQWTPGPWYVDHDGVTVRAAMLKPPVQVAGCGAPTSTYAQANARLIAAAPDLCAALHTLLTNRSLTEEDERIVCAALAKAEGR